MVVLMVVLAARVAVPVQAQAARVPPLADMHSLQRDYVAVFRGVPLVVRHEVWESAQRVHGAVIELVTYEEVGLVAGRTTEYVFYEGVYYERVDQETTWRAYPEADYDPNKTINQLIFTWVTPGTELYEQDHSVSNLGGEEVRGVATTHYQLWSQDAAYNAAEGGQYVYDIWVTPEGMPMKDQISVMDLTVEGIGTGRLENTWVYDAHNTPMTVSRPPAEQVMAGATGEMGQQSRFTPAGANAARMTGSGAPWAMSISSFRSGR
jgi:hypothetical protein